MGYACCSCLALRARPTGGIGLPAALGPAGLGNRHRPSGSSSAPRCRTRTRPLRGDGTDHAAVREVLAIEKFIHPRPLWWAFDWQNAADQAQRVGAPAPSQPAGCDPANGVVVLIDEVDKADAEVPNGLLEALGAGEFTPEGLAEPVTIKDQAAPPLVMITTNEERNLPDAFPAASSAGGRGATARAVSVLRTATATPRPTAMTASAFAVPEFRA